MEIDAKLLKFEANVSPYLEKLDTFEKELTTDITNLLTLNNVMVDNLNESFQSSGGTSVLAQMEYINQTVKKIEQSLESELGKMIEDCKKLHSGIKELEQILGEYNSNMSRLNKMEQDDPNWSSIAAKVTSSKQQFEIKNQELCKSHDELLARESGSEKLKEFQVTESTTDTGLTITSNVTSDNSVSIYYEVNGVIYQKVLPYSSSSGGVGATYTIAYDKNAIVKAVGQDSEMGKQAISFLNSKLKGNNDSQVLWKMFGKSYTNKECSDIGKIMDVILEGSYKANNCKSVSDYATVAAVVATNSLVTVRNGSSGNTYTKGFTEVVKSGYNCIEFTAWTYYQGLLKTNQAGNNNLKGVTLYEIFENSEKIENMSSSELLSNLKPGTIISRYGSGSGHTGTVLGVVKSDDGSYRVKIAQAQPSYDGGQRGVVVNTWRLDQLTNDWSRLMSTDTMTKRAVEGKSAFRKA